LVETGEKKKGETTAHTCVLVRVICPSKAEKMKMKKMKLK
jgi:hypothetical protein